MSMFSMFNYDYFQNTIAFGVVNSCHIIKTPSAKITYNVH